MREHPQSSAGTRLEAAAATVSMRLVDRGAQASCVSGRGILGTVHGACRAPRGILRRERDRHAVEAAIAVVRGIGSHASHWSRSRSACSDLLVLRRAVHLE